MNFLADLDPADPSLGGKARSLARLAAAGLRTPAGFVVGDQLFRALREGGPPLPARVEAAGLEALDAAAAALEAAPFPAGFDDQLRARLAALGCELFSVRSSFAAEDRPGEVAAGVYESRVGVTLDEVPGAMRAVLRSALAPGAVAYALARGETAAAPPMAVLIHGYVAGDSHGHAARTPEGPPLFTPDQGRPGPGAREHVEAALATLARDEAVELEWTAAGDEVTFLQLRPYRAPAPARAWAGFAALDEDPAAWRWDAAHNPLPLSPAHAGLVALADERCQIGIRQRVLGGYLFWRDGGPPSPIAITPEEVRDTLAALRADADARLTALGPAPPLEDALALFLSVYQAIFGVIQPASRAGREALTEFLRAHLPRAVPRLPALLAGVPSMASERRRRADDPAAYRALFGDEAPIWDLAEPTYAERDDLPVVPPAHEPAPLADPLAGLSPARRAEGERRLAVARDCAAAGEDDDWLYARAQTAVRRAILGLGERLQRSGAVQRPEDLFLWPLSALIDAEAGALPSDPQAQTEAGRAAMAAARLDPPPGPTADGSGLLKGWGTGGRAVGPVHRHDRARPFAAPADAVIVADTLLPTELPLIRGAALVTETGGPLDHVAAQARERGLPAVVGVAGAAALPAGALVLVDADRGIVVRL